MDETTVATQPTTKGPDMAGRPRTMARKVQAMEEQSLALMHAAEDAIPDQYLDQYPAKVIDAMPERNPALHPLDGLGQAWYDAVSSTQEAVFSLERLGDRLRAKAGIRDPGPLAQHEAAVQDATDAYYAKRRENTSQSRKPREDAV